jgi:tetratricopeptide (TPR) repeat protein
MKTEELQKSKRNKRKRLRTVLCVMLGAVMLLTGTALALWQDWQAILYNQGLKNMQEYAIGLAASADGGDDATAAASLKQLVDATKMFRLSIEVYKAERFVLPRADRHLAAKASFQEANCLIWLGKFQDAAAAYEQSLALNPGGDNDQFAPDTHVVQHNLEVLLNSQPDLQKQSGQGEGQGNQSDPKQQGPPSNQAGHSDHTML